MKALIVGDLHIGKGTSIGKDPVGVGLNSRVKDQKRLLNHIGRLSLENNVDNIFLLGDIWEEVNPKSSFVKIFFEWIKALLKYDKKIYIIMGNHDFVRSGHDRVSMIDSLKVLNLDGVHFITDISSEIIDNVNFVFMPFCDRKQVGSETVKEAIDVVVNNIKEHKVSNKTNIILGHMTLEGSLWVGDEIDQTSNELFLPLSSFDDFDYVWMGHIHRWQVLKEKPHIAHVGSLDKTSFGEGDKFVVLFDSKTKQHSYLDLPCRKLVDLKITVPTEEKDATKIVLKEIEKIQQENFNGAIVRVSVKMNSHDTETCDKDLITKKLQELNAFHMSSFNESRDVDRVIIKNAELDETINHFKAVDIFADTVDVEENFKIELKDVCKGIIKEYQTTKRV